LYGSFKRNLVHDVKVAQLSGYISEKTLYHHGEVSLQGTIVTMAQDFVGANNLPLLLPVGQFGSRHSGGDDAASARYIYTKLNPITRHIFNAQDDVLLDYVDEDGIKAEPEVFAPVIPFVLVNGAHGIGTGYMCSVPKYNPLDLIRYIRAKLDGSNALPALKPHFEGFKGKLELNQKTGKYKTIGVVDWVGRTGSAEISELPVGQWTQSYKTQVLEKLISQGLVQNVSELHTDEAVKFRVKLTTEGIKSAESIGLIEFFKLTKSHHVSVVVYLAS
jgi:DNA topoisomerase-2